MSKLAAKLRFIWEYWAKGMHRPTPVSLEDGENCPYPPPDERLMGTLARMYGAHGCTFGRHGPWLEIDVFKLLTRVSYFEHDAPPGKHSVQMDVVTVLVEPPAHIIESVGGFGSTLDEALQDALENYADSVFHVLLAALLGKGNPHVGTEHWTIGKMPRKVTLGGLRYRGAVPSEEWPPILAEIQYRLSRMALPPGLHWARYYYAWIPGGNPYAEVLIDNETEPELEEHLAQQAWPQGEEYYTRRLFFTIQDA